MADYHKFELLWKSVPWVEGTRPKIHGDDLEERRSGCCRALELMWHRSPDVADDVRAGESR